MDFGDWVEVVQTGAAIRRVRRMQPAGGAGDKLFPPTYPGEGRNPVPRHVFEFRRIGAQNIQCVLIDSVQSQANRLEEALGYLRAEGLLWFPVITSSFIESNDLSDIGTIDTLQAPHRIFDAVIRDSMLNGVPFGRTEQGEALVRAKPDAAQAIYRLSPSALVFGAWNSTSMGGGLGAKFPRTVVSEIIGVGVAVGADGKPSGQRTGSRIDPLGIRSSVQVVKDIGGDWHIANEKDRGAIKPSEINHSNIAPTVAPLGVSVDFAQQNFVLSLPAVRRLRFAGRPDGPSKADEAAHAALAALALAACVGQDRAGYALRSRCDLVLEAGQTDAFELVHANGSTHELTLDLKTICRLFRASVDAAAEGGVAMQDTDLTVQPQEKLLELVRRSRQKALRGEADPEDVGA